MLKCQRNSVLSMVHSSTGCSNSSQMRSLSSDISSECRRNHHHLLSFFYFFLFLLVSILYCSECSLLIVSFIEVNPKTSRGNNPKSNKGLSSSSSSDVLVVGFTIMVFVYYIRTLLVKKSYCWRRLLCFLNNLFFVSFSSIYMMMLPEI